MSHSYRRELGTGRAEALKKKRAPIFSPYCYFVNNGMGYKLRVLRWCHCTLDQQRRRSGGCGSMPSGRGGREGLAGLRPGAGLDLLGLLADGAGTAPEVDTAAASSTEGQARGGSSGGHGHRHRRGSRRQVGAKLWWRDGIHFTTNGTYSLQGSAGRSYFLRSSVRKGPPAGTKSLARS